MSIDDVPVEPDELYRVQLSASEFMELQRARKEQQLEILAAKVAKRHKKKFSEEVGYSFQFDWLIVYFNVPQGT